jgi:hypothetical protein
MIFKLSVQLNNLHCIVPTDPSGEDEPYLWVFYAQIDSSTVRQRPGDPSHLTATISFHTGPGDPGNLGVSGVTSGGNIHIPPVLGTWSTTLKPIPIDTPAGRVFVPATPIIYAVVIDEDGTPHHIIKDVFFEVQPFVRDRVNDFLNGLDLLDLVQQARNAVPPVDLRTFLRGKVDTFIEDLKHQVHDFVHDEVLDKTLLDLVRVPVIGLIEALSSIDADEQIGNGIHFTPGEDDIIGNSLSMPLHKDMKQHKNDPDPGAWYVIDGFLQGDIEFTAEDISADPPITVSKPGDQPMTVTFTKDHIPVCIYAGTTLELTVFAHTQTYKITRQYPFAQYQYSINGQPLNGSSGSISFSQTVQFQEFNEDSLQPAFPFIVRREETRMVSLTFQKSAPATAPQLEALSITNNPADGNYDVILEVQCTLGNGRVIPVASVPLSFTGQTLEFPADVKKHMKQCLSNFIGTRWAKSKMFNPRDPGPIERMQEYESISQELDRLAEVGAFNRTSIERMKQVVAVRLNVKPAVLSQPG